LSAAIRRSICRRWSCGTESRSASSLPMIAGSRAVTARPAMKLACPKVSICASTFARLASA
jgi:hypothetical protein